MVKYLICFILYFVYSCSGRKKEVNCENFSMKIPINWTFIDGKGIDSQYYYLISHEDTINLEIGHYNWNFSEDLIIIDENELYNILKLRDDENRVFLSRDTILDEKQALFHKNYYYYDTINNNVLKFCKPKKDLGTFGIYCDSIDRNKSKFTLWVENPSESTKNELDEIIKTIKFDNPMVIDNL